MTESVSTLHIISKTTTASQHDAMITAGDGVIYIQDAVYQLNAINLQPEIRYYAREKDCLARSITPPANITEVDDQTWVALCAGAKHTISW